MKINQLKAGSLLSYVTLAVGCIIPILYTPVMLSILGQNAYGLYALTNSVVSYLGLLNFGMGSAVIRYVTMYRAKNRIEDIRRLLGLFTVIFGILSLLVCVGGVVLIIFAGPLFGQGLTGEEIATMRVLLAVLTAHTAISFPMSIYFSTVISYERYLFHKLLALIETIAAPIINLALLYAGFGVIGLAAGTIVTGLISSLIYIYYCVKKLGIYPVFNNMPLFILKELAGFCAFVFLSSIVDMLYWATDKVLIGAMLGSAAVAVYNIGGTFTAMLQNMALSISSVFSPRVNIMVANNESNDALSELLIRIGRLQYLLISLILSGYIVFGQDFIRLWAGPEYSDAYYVALLTMIPLSVPLIQNIAFAILMARNEHRFRSIMYAIVAVINLVSTWLVLPYFGIIGAAVCTAAAFVLGNGIIMNIYYYRVTGLDIPKFWGNILKMSIVPAIMIALGLVLVNTVLPVSSLWVFLGFAAGFTVIFCLLSWLVSMNRYEKELILSLLRKFLPKKS